MALDLGSFSPLGTFSVPPKTRLVQGACNPEKDLVLLIHRGEPRDTISLWKLQGAKRWEIDTIANYETTGLLRDVSWSPDGDRFAVGHATQRVTVHNVADGCEVFKYNDAPANDGLKSAWKMASVVWLHMPWIIFWTPKMSRDPPPQLYQRDYDSPGSALYLLKQLPKLDYKAPLIERMDPSEGSSTYRAPQMVYPPDLEGLPSLVPNPTMASIALGILNPNEPPPIDDPTEPWSVPQGNTCLFVGDNHGGLYSFIHGTYLTGVIETKPTLSHLMTIVTGDSCVYFSRFCTQTQGPSLRLLALTGRLFPTDSNRNFIMKLDYGVRDMLRISTASKDLLQYIGHSLQEARLAWMGAPGHEGGREGNVRWCRVLSMHNQHGSGAKGQDIKADLTSLLLTGIPLSSSLLQHMEEGSQTTERNFAKWNTHTYESLSHVRHCAEIARVALQRLIALLWDLRGLAQVQSVATDFMLKESIVYDCIESATLALEMFVQMADTSRREMRGFDHFMVWLRGLIPNLPSPDPPLKPYDLLIVNNYIADGFCPSGLDAFFQMPNMTWSPTPTSKPTPQPQSLSSLASETRNALKALKRSREVGEPSLPPEPFILESDDKRHVLAALSTLMRKCSSLFQKIAFSITATKQLNSEGEEVSRTVENGLHVKGNSAWMEVTLPQGVKGSMFREGLLEPLGLQEILLRERIVVKSGDAIQYIFLRLPNHEAEDKSGQKICLVQLHHASEPPKTKSIRYQIFNLEFSTPNVDEDSESEQEVTMLGHKLLDAQFYDDEQLVLILQTPQSQNKRYIALFNYAKAEYRELPMTVASSNLNIETHILQPFMRSRVQAIRLIIDRARSIPYHAGDTISLSVSNKRKVVCILDHDRWTVQSHDLSADEGEDEEQEEDLERDASNLTIEESMDL